MWLLDVVRGGWKEVFGFGFGILVFKLWIYWLEVKWVKGFGC